MPNCAVINCKNCTNVSRKKIDNVSFHRFPHDPNLKEKWIVATGNKDWFPTKYSTICSIHFEETNFEEGKKRRTLTKTAYPTIDVLKITITPNEVRQLISLCTFSRFFDYNQKTSKRFPNEPELKEKWIACTQRANWKPSKYSVICSTHFTEDCFYTMKHGRRLFNTAIPTLYLPQVGNADEPSSSSSKPSNKKRKLDDDDSEYDDNGSDTEDEYDVWAKKCAIELRQMAPEQQMFAKRAITYVLMEGRLGLLNSNSVQVNNKVPSEETDHEGPNVSVLDEFLVIHKRSRETSSVAVPQKIGTSSGSSPPLIDAGSSFRAASHKTVTHSSRVRPKPPKKTTVSASQQTATSVDASKFDSSGSNFIVSSHTAATPVCSSSLVVKTKVFNDSNKTTVSASQQTATLVDASKCDSSGSNFIVSSHTTTTQVCSSSLVVKTKVFDDPGSSLVMGSHNIAASDSSTSKLVKLESFDDTELSTDEPAIPLDSSTFLVKLEPSDDPLGSISLSCAAPVRRSSHGMSEPNSPPSSPDFTTVVIKNEQE